MSVLCVFLAVLSIWDYPARFPDHDRLRRQFVVAMRSGDTATMEETCRKGVKLLPDDPTWHYNYACSLAYFKNREKDAFDELETAVDLGFRDVEAIKKDTDLKRLAKLPRYKELLEYAEFMKTRPIISGPMATVDATGIFGEAIALGQQNLGWDFDVGAFVARLRLAQGSVLPHTGELYMNRDAGHSPLKISDFPGLTEVKLDAEGRTRHLDVTRPNIIFPYPTFGNSSMAFVSGPYWRSISRALLTNESLYLPLMQKMYLSNQFWVFPSNVDTAPVGTNGDLFASISPYYLTSAGRSFSDRPLLAAALHASAALKPAVKAEIVRRGLLTPTLQTLMRKSLRGVFTEEDYITWKAHPTAMPPDGIDTNRLVAAAAKLQVSEIAPLVPVSIAVGPASEKPLWPELTYMSPFATAFVLRTKDAERRFSLRANGAAEYAFVQTHGNGAKAVIERVGKDAANITIPTAALSPTNRIDIAVFGKNKGTGWGAPSYISFSRVDSAAPYSDPCLTPRP